MSLLPNYNPFFAATLGTIYSRQWVPAPPFQGRQKLLSVHPIQNLAFWHVQIRPRGEVYVPVEWVEDYLGRNDDTNPPRLPASAGFDITLPEFTLLQNSDGLSELFGAGRTYGSIFKVRLTWKDGGGTKRCIDFDLGSGVDVITPPAHFVEAELLVPVPGTELNLPIRLRELPLGAAVQLEAKADCIMGGTSERDNNVKFTDTVFFDRSEQTDELVIPRRKSTSRFQASSSNDFGEIFTRWDRNIPGFGIDLFGRQATGTFTATLGDRQTLINDIPGGTNVFTYEFPDNVDQATFSLVQELSF